MICLRLNHFLLERYSVPGNRISIPKELRGRLPRMIEEFADRNTILLFYGITLPIFFVMVFSRVNNGWMYLIPNVAGPILSALFFMVRPFNPYRSIYAVNEGMEDADMHGDVAAKRLALMFRSRKSKFLLLRTGMFSSALLCLIAWATALITPGPVKWSFDAGKVITGSVILGILSVGFHIHILLRWAFRSWTQKGDDRKRDPGR